MKKKLEKSGYKVTTVLSTGKIVVSKGYRYYVADTLTEIFHQIFG